MPAEALNVNTALEIHLGSVWIVEEGGWDLDRKRGNVSRRQCVHRTCIVGFLGGRARTSD